MKQVAAQNVQQDSIFKYKYMYNLLVYIEKSLGGYTTLRLKEKRRFSRDGL